MIGKIELRQAEEGGKEIRLPLPAANLFHRPLETHQFPDGFYLTVTGQNAIAQRGAGAGHAQYKDRPLGFEPGICSAVGFDIPIPEFAE